MELSRIEKLRRFWLSSRITALNALKKINPALCEQLAPSDISAEPWKKPRGMTWPMLIHDAISDRGRPILYDEIREFSGIDEKCYKKHFSSITKAVSLLANQGEVFVVKHQRKKFIALPDHINPESIQAQAPELKDRIGQQLESYLHEKSPDADPGFG